MLLEKPKERRGSALTEPAGEGGEGSREEGRETHSKQDPTPKRAGSCARSSRGAGLRLGRNKQIRIRRIRELLVVGRARAGEQQEAGETEPPNPPQRAGDTSSPSPSPKQQRKALRHSRSLTVSPKTTQSSPKTIFPSPQTPQAPCRRALRATGRGRLEKTEGLVPSEQNH